MGGKRCCHNITGIMQNMTVVPGGELPSFPTERDIVELFPYW